MRSNCVRGNVTTALEGMAEVVINARFNREREGGEGIQSCKPAFSESPERDRPVDI